MKFPPALASGKIISGCGALKSSGNDMLAIYDCFLKACSHQKKNETTSGPDSPFYQTEMMLPPYFTKRATSYGLRWFLVKLPEEIGWIGINEARVKKLPPIARGTCPTQLHNIMKACQAP